MARVGYAGAACRDCARAANTHITPPMSTASGTILTACSSEDLSDMKPIKGGEITSPSA